MSNHRMLLAAVTVVSLVASGIASAQQSTTKPPPPNTSSSSATTANPELERQLSPPRMSMKRQKRANCERQAAKSRLSKWKFMRKCMRG